MSIFAEYTMHVLIDKFGGYINIPIANLSFIVSSRSEEALGALSYKGKVDVFQKGFRRSSSV